VTRKRAHRARLAFAAVLASVLWGGFITHSGWLWAPPRQQPIPERPVDMKLVVLAAPAGESTTRPVRATSPTSPAPPAFPRPEKAPQRPRVHEPVRHPVARAVVPPPSRQPTTTPEPAPGESPPAQARQRPSNPAPVANASTTSTAGVSSPNAGNAPARLLSQPLPDLPDDLRDVAYRTTAIARFTVHADGTTDIELIRPTPMPRLNRILLDALRRWRFAPATENGRPVESHQDVRVHFNVN